MKYVVTIPVVLLVVTLALFTSIYPIIIPWKPVFASPTVITNSPNANTGDWINPINAYADDTNWASSTPSAPVIASKGTLRAVTTGNLALTLPSSITANDIIIAVILWAPNTATDVVDIATPTGYSQITQYSTPTSTPIDGKIVWFWKRASGGETTVTITRPTGCDTGSDTCFAGQSYRITGCITTGNPWDAFVSNGPSTSTTVTYLAVTVSGSGRTLFANQAIQDNVATATPPSGYTVLVGADNTNRGTDVGFATYGKSDVYSDGAVTNTISALAQGYWGSLHISFISPTTSRQHQYSGYGFNIGSGAIISQVRVRLDVKATSDDKIKLEASSNGGTSYLATTYTSSALTTSEQTIWVDITSWDTWAPAKLNSNQIWTRVTQVETGTQDTVWLDWIPIEVTYNLAPTNDQLTLDLTGASYKNAKTLLCAKQDYKFVYLCSDANGVTDLTYAQIQLDPTGKNVSLRATRGSGDAWTFSEQSDPSNYVTLNTDGSTHSTSGNQKTFNFLVTINWNWGDSAETVTVRCYVIDASSASDQDDYANIFGVEAHLTAYSLAVSDYRCNPSQTSLTFSGYWYYDGTSIAPPDNNYAVVVKLSGVQKGSTDITLVSGAFSINDVTAESTISSYSYTTEATYMSGAGSFPAVIVDRMKVTGYARSDDRANINVNVTIDATVVYEYDNTAVTTGTLTINTYTATHIGSGVYRISRTSASVTSVTYNTVAGSESTYGLNTVNQNSQSTTVIWDKARIYYEQLDDSRVNINTNIEFRVKGLLLYDNHALGSGDTVTANFGALSWDVTNSWFDGTRTQATVGNYTFSVSSLSEATYSITVFETNVTNPLGVWDRIEIYEKDEPIIGQASKTETLYSDTPSIFPFPTFVLAPLLLLSFIKYKRNKRSKILYSILAFLLVVPFLCLTKPVLASDQSVPVNTYVIIWFKARYDYDNASYTNQSSSTLSINGTLATYNATGGYWQLNVTQSVVGNYTYFVSAISDGVYGLTVINDVVGGITIEFTPPGYDLNLRVMDYDLIDPISGAYVYKDSDVKTSDSNGWANWTLVSGTVQIKVRYFGFWVNGTFSVTMDYDKTINVQCKLYDVTVLVQESVQNAYLAGANVTVYNSTSVQGNKITSGVTGNNGQVQLLNLPNNTLTFTQYGGASYSLVIGNTTPPLLVSSENQTIPLTADKNNVNTNNNYSIIAFAGLTIPFKSSFVTNRLKKKMQKRSETNEDSSEEVLS